MLNNIIKIKNQITIAQTNNTLQSKRESIMRMVDVYRHSEAYVIEPAFSETSYADGESIKIPHKNECLVPHQDALTHTLDCIDHAPSIKAMKQALDDLVKKEYTDPDNMDNKDIVEILDLDPEAIPTTYADYCARYEYINDDLEEQLESSCDKDIYCLIRQYIGIYEDIIDNLIKSIEYNQNYQHDYHDDVVVSSKQVELVREIKQAKEKLKPIWAQLDSISEMLVQISSNNITNEKMIEDWVTEHVTNHIDDSDDQWIKEFERILGGTNYDLSLSKDNKNVVASYTIACAIKIIMQIKREYGPYLDSINKDYILKPFFRAKTDKKGNIQRYVIAPTILRDNVINKYNISRGYDYWSWDKNSHQWKDIDNDSLNNLIDHTIEEYLDKEQQLYLLGDIDFDEAKAKVYGPVRELIKKKVSKVQCSGRKYFGSPVHEDDVFYVQFLNGTLNVKNWTWYENTWFKEKHITNTVPYKFQFFNTKYELENDDDVQFYKGYIHTLLQDPREEEWLECLIGSIAIRQNNFSIGSGKYNRQNMLVLFHGRKGNEGKTTLTQRLEDMFGGTSNVSNIDYQTLTSNRFGLYQLKNKLLNISPELSYASAGNAETLKKISGGDSLYLEKKGSSTNRTMPVYATTIFVANSYPRLDDTSRALRDRLVVIEFPERFKPELRTKFPMTRLKNEIVMMKFLAYCLYLLYEQVNDIENHYVMSDTMKLNRDKWYEQGGEDLIAISDSFIIDENYDGGLPKNVVLDFLVWLSDDIGSKNRKHARLEENLRNALPDLNDHTTRITQQYGWQLKDKCPDKKYAYVYKHLRFDQEKLKEYLISLTNKNESLAVNAIMQIPTDQLEGLNLPTSYDNIYTWFADEIEPYIKHTTDPDEATIMHDQVLYTLYTQHYENVNPHDLYKHNLMDYNRFANGVVEDIYHHKGYKRVYTNNDPSYRHRYSSLGSLRFDWASRDRDFDKPREYQDSTNLPAPFNSKCRGWYRLVKEDNINDND